MGKEWGFAVGWGCGKVDGDDGADLVCDMAGSRWILER